MAEKNQTNSKPGRGGARPNAGRKKGSATKRTREIANKVIERAGDGSSPLEVMLDIMNELRAAALLAKKSEDPEERKGARKLLVLAADVAKDAAPYVHPRLAAIEHTGKDGSDLTPAGPVINLSLSQ